MEFKMFVIQAGQLIDGTGAEPLKNVRLFIDNGYPFSW